MNSHLVIRFIDLIMSTNMSIVMMNARDVDHVKTLFKTVFPKFTGASV